MSQIYRPWLKHERDTLATMRARGASFEEIAATLKRTPKSCKACAQLYGIRLPKEKISRRMYKNAWTPEQDAQLVALRAKGLGFEAIALAVGHTLSACTTRAAKLGARKPDEIKTQAPTHVRRKAFHRAKENHAAPLSETKARGKWRPCMCCQDKFWSTGPGNRLCNNCRQISVSPLAMPARVLG